MICTKNGEPTFELASQRYLYDFDREILVKGQMYSFEIPSGLKSSGTEGPRISNWVPIRLLSSIDSSLIDSTTIYYELDSDRNLVFLGISTVETSRFQRINPEMFIKGVFKEIPGKIILANGPYANYEKCAMRCYKSCANCLMLAYDQPSAEACMQNLEKCIRGCKIDFVFDILGSSPF